MAGRARSRSRDRSVSASGRFYHPGTKQWTSGAVNWTNTETTGDVVGNWKGVNTFDNTRNIKFPREMVGQYNGWIFESYPWYNYTLPTHGDTGVASNLLTQYANKLCADTNPNTAHVSIPTFVGELRELPGLIRSFGAKHLKMVSQYRTDERFAQEAASRYLQWRWGIKPMISDFRKMLDFVSAVEKRMDWIKRLSEKGSLRRRRKLDIYRAQSESNVTMWNQGFTVAGSKVTTTYHQVWGTVKWTYNGVRPMTKDPNDHLKMARRMTFGLTPDNILPTAWELMPWSWLIDWFTGFGDFLESQGNFIPVKPVDICIMKHKVTKTLVRVTTPPPKGLTINGDIGTLYETKRRQTVASPSPFTFSALPLLSGDKWSILGSLAISRRLLTK